VSPALLRLFLMLCLGLCWSCGSPAPPPPSSSTPPDASGAPRRAVGDIVDLTHPFDSRTIYWPTEPLFDHHLYTEGETESGAWYASGRFSAAEHGGTHIDAPYHFWRAGSTVDLVSPDRLIGPGVLIDATEACAGDSDHIIGIEELTLWEANHGRIPTGSIVLLRTGFGDFYPDPERYMGTAERGPDAVARLHFPGLAPEAARWLAVERDIAAVGLDTPSIDHGRSTTYDAHVAIFEHDIPAFENVANLHLLPPTGFTVIALPMLIRGGTGAPLRIVAIMEPR